MAAVQDLTRIMQIPDIRDYILSALTANSLLNMGMITMQLRETCMDDFLWHPHLRHLIECRNLRCTVGTNFNEEFVPRVDIQQHLSTGGRVVEIWLHYFRMQQLRAQQKRESWVSFQEAFNRPLYGNLTTPPHRHWL